MSYADNDGVRIHYQVVGAGKPLVPHHGFTESIEDWSECGYVDALRSRHRLVLIDARGHGRSEPNKAGLPVAEAVEPRAGEKGNADQQSVHRTQSRKRVTEALDRVRQIPAYPLGEGRSRKSPVTTVRVLASSPRRSLRSLLTWHSPVLEQP